MSLNFGSKETTFSLNKNIISRFTLTPKADPILNFRRSQQAFGSGELYHSVKGEIMKKIIIDELFDTIKLSDVNTRKPIFAKRHGKLRGMLVLEDDGRWILRNGGSGGATGYHDSVETCIKSCLQYNYEFFTE